MVGIPWLDIKYVRRRSVPGKLGGTRTSKNPERERESDIFAVTTSKVERISISKRCEGMK